MAQEQEKGKWYLDTGTHVWCTEETLCKSWKCKDLEEVRNKMRSPDGSAVHLISTTDSAKVEKDNLKALHTPAF